MVKLKEIYKIIKEQLHPNPYTLYCDMDGVLCDFERRFEDLTGMSPKKLKNKKGLDEFWRVIDEDGVRFWVGMPWMPDGKKLWKFIKPLHPTLLSAPSWDNTSRLGKRLWVRNNTPDTKLILASRANKQQYSKKNSILIDDMPQTIEEWESGGGIGILHTSANSTIDRLKQLGL